MNGPFHVSDYGYHVRDKDGNDVATGDGADEEAESKNAEMVCNALNAVFFAVAASRPLKD